MVSPAIICGNFSALPASSKVSETCSLCICKTRRCSAGSGYGWDRDNRGQGLRVCKTLGYTTGNTFRNEALPLHGEQRNKIIKSDSLHVEFWHGHDTKKEDGMRMK
jgi:hypothetical protein